MNAKTEPPPVDRRVTVRLAPARAFEFFTAHMAAWWPFAGHSCSGDPAAGVRFEPGVGGAVVEVASDGREFRWGTLREWNPPAHFVMSWHPGLPVAQATALRVSFSATPAGTEVRVLHEGWLARGDAAQAKRDQYDGGWPLTLDAFAAAAHQRAGA